MMGAPRGFTIIEVMIVLSISAIMLLSAATVFSGRRQGTEFSQAVYDVQSKFQSWANDVSSSSVPGLQQYTCGLNSSGTGPVLTAGTTGSTGKDCIYLGQAIQIVSGGTTIYSYPIFGLRTKHDSSGVDSNDFPSSADQANLEPALNSTGTFLLIDSYSLLNGLSVYSAKASSTGNENDLLTLYSSLQNSNTSGNEITVSSYEKTFTSQDTATLKSCVEARASGGCGNPALIPYTNNTIWNLCLSNGTRKAKLSVAGTATGITTKLDMDGVGC